MISSLAEGILVLIVPHRLIRGGMLDGGDFLRLVTRQFCEVSMYYLVLIILLIVAIGLYIFVKKKS